MITRASLSNGSEARVDSQHIVSQALAHYDAGLNVCPPREDGSKHPDLPEWKQFQAQRPPRERVEAMYRTERAGIGWLTGVGSGNLEVLDFDDRATFNAYRARAAEWNFAELIERVATGYSSETPG